MKKVKNCEVKNCIPTPTGCVEWDGGDIKFLGICNGDPINNLLYEIIGKLESIAGDELSGFDLDGLLDVCNLKAPQEVSLINILNLIKANQICLKDFANTLSERIALLSNQSKIDINLKCYQQFDNINNPLQISRDELDQLIINELCSHSSSIQDLNGKVTLLERQITNLEQRKVEVEELTFATCVDGAIKPTSSQVIAIAKAHCELESATGAAVEINRGVSKLADDDINWDALFTGNPDWINLADAGTMGERHGLHAVILKALWKKVKFMEENCCAVTCDDILLGFSATMVDADSILIKFDWGNGTKIPNGIIDKGSKGTIKDKSGNVKTFNIIIGNNSETEISVAGLDLTADLQISITAKLGNDTLMCEKCLGKTFKPAKNCAYCEITNMGATGNVTIIYEETIY